MVSLTHSYGIKSSWVKTNSAPRLTSSSHTGGKNQVTLGPEFNHWLPPAQAVHPPSDCKSKAWLSKGVANKKSPKTKSCRTAMLALTKWLLLSKHDLSVHCVIALIIKCFEFRVYWDRRYGQLITQYSTLLLKVRSVQCHLKQSGYEVTWPMHCMSEIYMYLYIVFSLK